MKLDLSTRRKRLRLALSMVRPIRCGGVSYNEAGEAMTTIGGKKLNPAEFAEFKLRREAEQLAEIAAFDLLTDDEVETLYPAVMRG